LVRTGSHSPQALDMTLQVRTPKKKGEENRKEQKGGLELEQKKKPQSATGRTNKSGREQDNQSNAPEKWWDRGEGQIPRRRRKFGLQ